jgi:hypothetical protein
MYSHNVALWCGCLQEVSVAAVKTVVVVIAVLVQDHAGQLPEIIGQGQLTTLVYCITVNYMLYRIIMMELCVLNWCYSSTAIEVYVMQSR